MSELDRDHGDTGGEQRDPARPAADHLGSGSGAGQSGIAPASDQSATGPESDQSGTGAAEPPRKQSARRAAVSARRIHEVFGDVLPETTSDERDFSPREGDRDEWYLANRPPHH
ncbi:MULTISPECIES: hypothetical protein [Thermocrispum]|jgi:hypothetical protein|uniref:Uncharacterized protein n=1 Tax=Thermocrispum agreste TaxID=37925 RepID=A0A2W4JT54_9PSEU|nr:MULTISPECIES: hypothetical protein [Thermocrispum]PZN01542.1 MAG: hypothetical protein DIU77_00330 [Thermocrispum agreste]